MHEKALMDDLMTKIIAVSDAEGGAAVTCVSVWLGALSHFTPEHFREHFEAAAHETCAESATVEVEVDDDVTDPHAQGVVLERVVVARAVERGDATDR